MFFGSEKLLGFQKTLKTDVGTQKKAIQDY
jgi:hypothetical protein